MRFRPYFGVYTRYGVRHHKARQMYLQAFEVFGSLYDADGDERLAAVIRADLEELGVPMGYGRVHETPTVLDDDYLPPLFIKGQF